MEREWSVGYPDENPDSEMNDEDLGWGNEDHPWGSEPSREILYNYGTRLVRQRVRLKGNRKRQRLQNIAPIKK
jgi:hypothetical protein